MPTTLVHGFVPALCGVQARPKFSFRNKLRLAASLFVLGNGADLDIVPASLFPKYFSLIHREWGHNVFSLVGITLVGVWVLRRWVLPGLFSRGEAYSFVAPAVFSHALLDAFGPVRSSGLPLLWPVSEHVWRIPLTFFPMVEIPHTGHPLWEMVTNPQYWGYTVFFEMVFIVTTVTLWSLMLRWWRRSPRASLAEQS